MKKLRYKRVILVIMIFVLFVSIVGYMYLQRSQYFEYKGPITTFTATYLFNTWHFALYTVAIPPISYFF